jgi:hypothetical protein
LFFSPQQSVADHFASLDGQPVEVMHYYNFEAVPARDDIGDFFRETNQFKIHPAQRSAPITAEGIRLAAATPQLNPDFFHSYSNGKPALRLSVVDAQVPNTHRFIRQGRPTVGRWSNQQIILHYPSCGFENFWTRYATRARFSSRYWGNSNMAAAIGPVHSQALDVVAAGDR